MPKRNDDVIFARKIAEELRGGPVSPPKTSFLKKKTPDKKPQPQHGGYQMFEVRKCTCHVCLKAKARAKARPKKGAT